ncbi:MAG: ribonuclease HII [Candidatus Omnitrophota bacterium]|nr:MAG: ribonuclease HII [Candidatus Omnitrophota bacterium]
MIVGIDEAGRGPLAGIVVGCALHLKKRPPFVVRDSKELSPQARESFIPWLWKNACFCVNVATPRQIDKLNILEATFLTFNRAIKGLLTKQPSLSKATFIVDGNLFRTNLNIKYICISKADKKVKEVSCASIVAKVVRDYFMKLADFLYPEWNFSRHKGYPTAEHVSLLEKYPPTPFHRRSFSPCKKEESYELQEKV